MGIMVYSMLVRCPQCFYENEERYRFCGMCGVALPRVGAGGEPEAKAREVRVGRALSGIAGAGAESAATPPVKERPPIPVTGPSFLGLSQDQDGDRGRDLEYLLEDDPEPGHGRMYLALILLLAAVAMLGWRWRHSGYFSRIRPAIVALQNGTPANTPSTPASTDPSSGSASTVAPHPDAPAQGSPAQDPPAAANPVPTADSAQPASAAANSEAAKPAQSEAASNSVSGDSENLDPKPEAPSNNAATSAAVEKAATAPTERAAPATAVAKSVPKPSPPAVAPSPAVSAPDPLVAEGEKYLYGNGVPQNCARAQKSLLAAAGHANPRAQSILGTMYATGHCVGRDLPTAYRWFARASHQEPTNARITRDLEVLWKQMTAGERRLAVNSRD
jgi:hypothetical protein